MQRVIAQILLGCLISLVGAAPNLPRLHLEPLDFDQNAFRHFDVHARQELQNAYFEWTLSELGSFYRIEDTRFPLKGQKPNREDAFLLRGTVGQVPAGLLREAPSDSIKKEESDSIRVVIEFLQGKQMLYRVFENTLPKDSLILQAYRKALSVIRKHDQTDGVGNWKELGERSAGEIMQVVKKLTPQLKTIYNQYLLKRPGFSGKVVLKFTIGPGGDVIAISQVSSSTQYPEFDFAIRDDVATWQYNAISGGNTTVTIPFAFSE